MARNTAKKPIGVGFFFLVLSLSVHLAEAANFVVERSQLRVEGEGFSASFPSAIGDVSLKRCHVQIKIYFIFRDAPVQGALLSHHIYLSSPSFLLSLQFGIPNYGAILVGQVAFVPENAAGCSEFFASLPPDKDILLVDRGSCYFVEKAYHAQVAGAKAVIVADNISEDLLTMASPENRPELAAIIAKLTIPTVLVTKEAGDQIKQQLQRSTAPVTVEIDWSESIAHGEKKVKWEYWFTTNDACGGVCTAQKTFFKNFRDTASSMEDQGYTEFTPHVMLKNCPYGGYECDGDCIRGRRYCAVEPIPSQFADKYSGADVVEMNARHLCAFQVASAASPPPPGGSIAPTGTGTRKWWDFASRFATSCSVETGTFTADCAHQQLQAAGIDVAAVEQCVGVRDTDAPLDILEAQLAAQIDAEGSGRGRVILLPTVVINYDQYRGSLTPGGVLRALCSGFAEGTEPSTCLSGGLEVDECAAGTHGCWTQGELTACVDTFRGFSCRCPAGWEGDGHTCTDIDECTLGISGCDQICINTPGSYHCECNTGYTLHGGQGAPGMCIPDGITAGTGGGTAGGHTRIPGWLSAVLFFASVASMSVAGIAVYRWRMRRDMEGEIRDIMREYMPLPAGDDAAEAGRGSSFFGGVNGRKKAAAAAAPAGEDYFSSSALPHEGYQAPQVTARTRSNGPSGRGGNAAMQLTPLGGSGGDSPL